MRDLVPGKMRDNHDDEQCDGDEILQENLLYEIEKIFNRKTKYHSIWALLSIVDKIMLILNFGTLLYCVLIPEGFIGLILSVYTLSVSVSFNYARYLDVLEKLLQVYQDHILLEVNDYQRYLLQIGENDQLSYLDKIRHVQKIENDNILKFMGVNFVLPHSLRVLSLKKVVACFIAYVVVFICIPVAQHYLTNPR